MGKLHQFNGREPQPASPAQSVNNIGAALPKQSVDEIDAAKIAASPTYNPKTFFYMNKPFRHGIPICLGLCLTTNGAAFVIALIGTIIIPLDGLYQWETQDDGFWFTGVSEAKFRAVVFLFYGFIPLVLALNTALELYHRYRNTLSPRRVVFTASFSLVLWLVSLGLSFSCEFGGFDVATFCPFSWSLAEGVIDFPLYNIGIVWIDTWFPPLGVAVYIPYLVLGALALHRSRTHWRCSWGVESGHGGQSAFELHPQTVAAYYAPGTVCSSARATEMSRSAITSTCYTSRHSNGHSLQETLHTDASSAISEPPSYNEKERISEVTVGCANCGHRL